LATLKSLCLDIYHRFYLDDGFELAGNIAFCTLLSLFPFLLFLTALAGVLGDEQLAETVISYLLSIAPEQIVAPLADEIHGILLGSSGGLLTLSVAFTLYTAAGGVESIRTGLNRSYGYRETRAWYFRFAQSILFVIGGAVLLLVLALLLVFGPLYWSKAESLIPALKPFTAWFHLLNYPVGLGLMFIGLTLSHQFLPVKRHKLTEIMPGIIVTIVLWLIAAWIYADYLTRFSRIYLIYAGVANVIIALIFLYITALLTILGGEINQSLIAHRERQAQAPTRDDTAPGH
jgi:membrane protein